MADTLRRLRVELEAGSTSFTKGFGDAAKSADSLGKSLQPVGRGMRSFGDAADSTNSRAGKLADTIGRTSTTLARSADAFGLPIGPLRALDDVADVAELGFKNLSSSMAGFNAASIGVAGAGLAIGAAIGGMLNRFASVRAVADDATRGLYDFLAANKLFGESTRDQGAGQTAGLTQFRLEQTAKHEEAITKQVASLRALGQTDKQIADFYKGQLSPALAEKLGLTEKDVEAEKKHEAASKKAAEAVKRLADERARFSEIVKAQISDKMIEEMANLPGFKTGLAEALMGGELATDIDLSKQLNLDEAVPQMQQFAFATKSFEENIAEAAQEMRNGGASANEIADALMRMGASAEEARQAIEGTVAKLSLGASLKAGLSAGLKDLPQVIVGALQGGGDVGKSVGAHLGGSIANGMVGPLTDILKNTLGKTLGSALGSIIPGIGTMLGSMLGGWISKGLSKLGIGGNKEVMKVNDLRDAFFEAHGGFVKLQEKLVGLTNQDLVKKIFDAKTVEQFNAAVAEVMGLLGDQEAAQQALDEATKRYGFTVEELGPTMQRQALDEQAAQLLKDWRLLTEGGLIPATTVIEKMGPDMVDFVKTSIKAGQAIPIAMKPMIEQLIASGQLLDENGEAFESAEDAGITFSESLTDGLSRAIDAIDRLVSALTGVPPVTIPVNVHYTKTGDVPPSGTEPPTEPGDQIPEFASGGIGDFGSGTLAMLHGFEAIIPLKRGGASGSDGLLNELRAMRAGQAELPRIMARAVRDALALSS